MSGAVPQIELIGVEKHYGDFHALKSIDLAIEKGSFVALVGPSGCGKSTLLRSIAGLESISDGELRIAGEDMDGVLPRLRDVAMVFQSYALYPHMTVEENLTYSLRLKGMKKPEARARAREVAETTSLTHLLDRYPRQLSGGQRQRVAMGRAIIRHPKAFLFDEPLSNLDAALRVQMRQEIRGLHDRLGATSVYVTHDQIEAMTMADRVVVMRDGVIEQEGRPLELYDHPANRFVAGFIGSPAMNFLPATVTDDGAAVTLDGLGAARVALAAPAAPGRPLLLGVRPEHLRIAAGEAGFPFEVATVESTGSLTYLGARGGLQLVQTERTGLGAGDVVRVDVPPGAVHLFDRESGARVG